MAGGCDAVKVVVRLRPSSESVNGAASASSSEAGNHRAVPHSHRRPPPCITQAGAASVAFADGSGFSYDAVAGASTDQESLFAAAGSPIVDAVLQGYNGCVIAYGQTGSGKTHTMLGSLSRDPRDGARGLAPRAFEALFERALAEAGGGASGGGATSSQRPPLRVSLSFVEIYNETITDLLAASGSSAHANEGGEHNNNNNSSSSLHLREEKGRGVFVDGATVLHVADAAAAISLLAKGAAARRSAETRANAVELKVARRLRRAGREGRESQNWLFRRSLFFLCFCCRSLCHEDDREAHPRRPGRLREAGAHGGCRREAERGGRDQQEPVGARQRRRCARRKLGEDGDGDRGRERRDRGERAAFSCLRCRRCCCRDSDQAAAPRPLPRLEADVPAPGLARRQLEDRARGHGLSRRVVRRGNDVDAAVRGQGAARGLQGRDQSRDRARRERGSGRRGAVAGTRGPRRRSRPRWRR